MKLTFGDRTKIGGESCHSPSPRPSPAGRGRIALNVFGQRESECARRALELLGPPRRCPLSLGERVRVRASVPPDLSAAEMKL
jgi:hypothetical protein